MDDNNNGVNYGPDPINNGGQQFVNSNPQSSAYNNTMGQQPPIYGSDNPDLDPGKGMATGALVCGILGFCCCGILNVVAIVLGIIARGKCTTDSNRKKATAGLVLGIIGLVISIIFSILSVINGTFNTITSSYDDPFSSSSYYYGY